MKAVCVSCFDYYETRTKGIIDYLHGKGYEVKYLITDFNHFSKSTYSVDYGYSLQLHVLPYKKNISPQRLVSHYLFAKKAAKQIRDYAPDLIYCIIPPNSLVKEISNYKAKNQKVRLIYDVYDIWPESFPNISIKNNYFIKLFFKKWASLRDKNITTADLLVSVSREGKAMLLKKYGLNTEVLFPNIALSELPEYSFDISKKIDFLYLGHINYITDIELGTKLLGKIAQKREVILHIIGEGQNREAWISMLNQVGVKVICHGVVFEQEKKKEIFEQCQFGLNIPKKEIKSSMALKSVEYMHFGLPFLNSGIGDNEMIVRKAGLGINIDTQTIENTVDKILEMSEKDVRKMHQRSIEYYKNSFASPNYNEVFNKVL